MKGETGGEKSELVSGLNGGYCIGPLLLFSHEVMSDSSRPRGLQPTSLLCPWDFQSKNTGVGCHFLLTCSINTKYTFGP